MKLKTKPFKHQAKLHRATKDRKFFALFWEMGTGKTLAMIMLTVYLYLKGEIDALLVIAFPKGVHRMWLLEELPLHMPDDLPYTSHIWRAGDLDRVGSRKALAALIKAPGLVVLTMNIEALSTGKGRDMAREFLTKRRALFVLDEGSCIKNSKTKRTKVIIGVKQTGGLAALALYRRLLTGTPVTESPFNLFTIGRFLDYTILGFNNIWAFKHFYGEWNKRINHALNQPFEELLEYRNLDKLKRDIAPHSSRVLKSECLDLPPKLYEKRPIELTPAQCQAYNSLVNEFQLLLDEDTMITVPLAITRLMKLQQITSGFIRHGDGEDETYVIVSEQKNPRLLALIDILEEISGQLIIRARFLFDTDAICRILTKCGISYIRYDGSNPNKDRDLDLFKAGKKKVMVATLRSGAYGENLQMANTVIYYSNDFSLETRLQSEDRLHREGQHNPVTYIDMIAEGTVDEQIVEALRAKWDIARYMTGDKLREWI